MWLGHRPARVNNPESGVSVYKAAKRGYIGFGIIFGFLVVATFTISIYDRGGDAVYALLTILVAAAFVFVWLSKFRLEVAEDYLRYETLWSERIVPLADIGKVDFDPAYFATYFGPVVRLIVHVRGRGNPPLVINAKVFSRSAVRHIMQLADRSSADRL